MSLLKDSYLKYVSNCESYLILMTSKKVSITVATGHEKFPHLVGQDYFPKYKDLPALTFIEAILGGQVGDYHINVMDAEFKSLVQNKLAAFTYVTKENIESARVFTSGLEICFGEKVFGHGVLLITLKNQKVVALILAKDKINLFHPKSIMLLTLTSKKYQLISKHYFENVVSYSTTSKRPIDDWPKKPLVKVRKKF